MGYVIYSIKNVLLLNIIEKGILSLDEMPERLRTFDKEPWRSRGLFQMPVDHFIVFYIPKRDNKTVSVIRVLYGGRDINEHFERQIHKLLCL